MLVWVILIPLLLSLGTTRYLIGYARNQGLIDLPNERSSHSSPTPRGGGVAIVLAFTAGIAWLAWTTLEDRYWLGVLAVTALAIARIGWMDDRKPISAKVRLCVHFLVSGAFVALLAAKRSAWPQEDLAILSAGSPLLAGVLAVGWLVGCLNFYNFMDGIDGIAAGEAVFLAAVSTALCWTSNDPNLASVYAILGAASLGFLIFNWAPAKIFMGDVGSGFLGFLFAALAIVADQRGSVPLSVSALLMGVFLVDTVHTLFRRARAGEKLMSAHREHAYQHASRAWGHRAVSTATLAIDCFWLLPWAWAAMVFPQWRWAFTALGLATLFVLSHGVVTRWKSR